jgi:methionine-gamma-lyase
LESEKDKELLARQFTSNGAMISFDIVGGEKEAFQFLDSLKLIKLAVSLGGTESLAEHPQTMTHADVPTLDKQVMNITEKLIRLSVGVEHYSDLITDINQALDKV